MSEKSWKVSITPNLSGLNLLTFKVIINFVCDVTIFELPKNLLFQLFNKEKFNDIPNILYKYLSDAIEEVSYFTLIIGSTVVYLIYSVPKQAMTIISVTCSPFLGNELANMFPRRCDSWPQTIAGY
jgi:hypothetical protein